jgi:glycerol-3-phosphate acyltransferase
MLRFSPLLAGEAFFYATSPVAKSFDSVYFLMNPRPEYSVQFLEPVRTRRTRLACR